MANPPPPDLLPECLAVFEVQCLENEQRQVLGSQHFGGVQV